MCNPFILNILPLLLVMYKLCYSCKRPLDTLDLYQSLNPTTTSVINKYREFYIEYIN